MSSHNKSKDKISPEKRSDVMRHVRSKDTKPEIKIRRALFALGYRYRIHQKELPGKPDIVFPRKKKVIFVHGCFWHGHNCAAGRNVPKSRTDYWIPKLEGNKMRDAEHLRKLKSDGWKIYTVWECQLRHMKKVIDKLQEFLAD